MTFLIQEMLQEGIIRPSTSPFFLFSYPNKKIWDLVFCVDYQGLNTITVKNRFPIPTINELLEELTTTKIFTKLELHSGYHQIRVHPSDCHKTTFRTYYGHYKFLVMPFCLVNAPSTFQATMNELLRPHLRHFVLVFFMTFSFTTTLCQNIFNSSHKILCLLQTHNFFIKESKCVCNHQGLILRPSLSRRHCFPRPR